MKKSAASKIVLSVLAFLALLSSCDSGGGGGGSSGGGISTGSADVKITIPKSTSSDINILGDFQISDTDNFYYEIYYSKPNGSSESEHKYTNAGADEPVTFSNVKYDTYTFFLKIWVDSRKQTVLATIPKEVAVSAQNNTVVFPDRSVSEYKNWFFVSTANDLSQAVTKISSDTTYSESNKAIICLRDNIELPNYQSILASVSSKAEVKYNGFKIAEQLFNVNISESITGGTVTASPTKGASGDEITLTVQASEHYRFKSLKKDGEELTVNDDGTVTFNMPASNVNITAEFIPVYTITYNLNGGAAVADSGFSASAEYTEDDFMDGVYTLPGKEKVSKEGYLFYGWYEEADFSGNKVTEIAIGNIGNKTFYARWIDSIYVKSDGVNTNDGLTADTPVNAIQTAVTKIQGYAADLDDRTFGWKIVVVGTLNGTQIINNFNSAASLEITGGESGGILNGNGNTTHVLSIDCAVPITIKNLKITGGKIGYTETGAGIYITSCSGGVTLGEGCEVTGNTALIPDSIPTGYASGIGIYVKNASLTLTDNAKVTDNNIDSSEYQSSVYHVYYGGGIYASSGSTVTISGSAEVTGNYSSPGYGKGVFVYGTGNGDEMLFLKDFAKVDEIYLDGGNGYEGAPSNLPKINVSGIASDSVKICGRPLGFVSGYLLLTGDGVSSNYNKFAVTGLFKIGIDGNLAYKANEDISISDMEAIPNAAWQTAAETKTFEELFGKRILFEDDVTETWKILCNIQKTSGNLNADCYRWGGESAYVNDYYHLSGVGLTVSPGYTITCSGETLTIPADHIIMD